MRIFRTGAAKGQVVGTAHINFFASSEGTIDACSVHWDGEGSFGLLLPAVAFDAVLPNLRRIPGDTEAGPGELWGKHAQMHALTEFEESGCAPVRRTRYAASRRSSSTRVNS